MVLLVMLAMLVMAVMMVLGRGIRRGGNHQNEQGGEQKFLHACIVASVGLRKNTTSDEEPSTRINPVKQCAIAGDRIPKRRLLD